MRSFTLFPVAILVQVFLLQTFGSFVYGKESVKDFYFSGDTIVKVVAGKQYKAGPLKRIFLGAHYRKEWTTPVEVEVFNIRKEKGGLKPVRQGGSRQTTNLRLLDSAGHQYVIRSVNKTPSRSLPEAFRKNAGRGHFSGPDLGRTSVRTSYCTDTG